MAFLYSFLKITFTILLFLIFKGYKGEQGEPGMPGDDANTQPVRYSIH